MLALFSPFLMMRVLAFARNGCLIGPGKTSLILGEVMVQSVTVAGRDRGSGVDSGM
jgi:hypothetical protein